MTENRENDKEKDQDKEKDKDKDHDRGVLSHLVDSPGRKGRERGSSTYSDDFRMYRSRTVSTESLDVITVIVETGQLNKVRHLAKDEQIGTQRVYKKTSANSVLTLYLPTREIVSCGTNPAFLKGILLVDPKLIQGYRVYAQLTLTFRYGREDEEVMGLRFCNEAIMSLHQVWPRTEDHSKEPLTHLQEALLKRLGDTAHPFTLSLTPQAPPSVQLVPAKRYYGAPIGTSYDVRCFIADKTEERFHRKASVKMGVRVIHRTDVFSSSGPENFATIINNQSGQDGQTTSTSSTTSSSSSTTTTVQNPPIASPTVSTASSTTQHTKISTSAGGDGGGGGGGNEGVGTGNENALNPTSTHKSKKSERGDSFPKLRLSPKAFRFSSRFGRSKSEAEKGPCDPFYNYSKSFQEYETCGGPQGAVDKPFLLQEGRVGLRASLDKSWYTHGEDVIVTVNIKNDSRKTVRRMRVCAIQHVDVCMFNNGKFKNVVADSDMTSPSGNDRIVGPGGTLNATIILKPQRGPTKNWIALEDSLQRSNEPEEIVGAIAASAVRTPAMYPYGCGTSSSSHSNISSDDRNVFAIYVSYYVKVKLTLSGMGGELSLKLPFALVHVEQPNKSESYLEKSNHLKELETSESISKLTLMEPSSCCRLSKINSTSPIQEQESSSCNSSMDCGNDSNPTDAFNKIESIDDHIEINKQNNGKNCSAKRKLTRHETVAKDLSSEDEALEETIMTSTKSPEVPKTGGIGEKNGEKNDGKNENSGNIQKQITCVQVHASSS